MAGKHWIAALLLAPLLWQPVAAQDDSKDGGVVIVNGTRSPELQPYRYMLSGLDAFDDYHELAPAATEVRFRLRTRKSAPDDAMDGLTVRLWGDKTELILPLAVDHSFVLPRNSAAEDDNADVAVNKKKSYYNWMPEVHSPGVPANMRRLGDLRLECRVLVGIGKNYIPFLLRATINTLLLTTDWCSFKDFTWYVRTDREITRATLVDGAQRVELKISKDGNAFDAPIGNKLYSNDALIQFE